MSAAQPFFDFPIVQGYSPRHDGVDIDAPAGYVVTALEDGDIAEAAWRIYGGEVAEAIPDTGRSDVTIHLDDIYVHPGEHVKTGQPIGTVGGGVGSKLLKAGRVQAATSQADFGRFSSGYHVHESEFEGVTPEEIERGWGDFSRTIDPTPLIAHLRASGQPIWSGPAPVAMGATLAANGSPIPGVDGIASAIQALNPATWGQALEHAAGFSDMRNLLSRVAVFGLGVTLFVGGVFIAVKGDEAAVAVIKEAPKAAAKAV